MKFVWKWNIYFYRILVGKAWRSSPDAGTWDSRAKMCDEWTNLACLILAIRCYTCIFVCTCVIALLSCKANKKTWKRLRECVTERERLTFNFRESPMSHCMHVTNVSSSWIFVIGKFTLLHELTFQQEFQLCIFSSFSSAFFFGHLPEDSSSFTMKSTKLCFSRVSFNLPDP